jgi:hypothetical protein
VDQKLNVYFAYTILLRNQSQIAHLQSIPASVENVRQWLEGLYSLTRQSKKPFIDDIPNTAIKICELFSSERGTVYSTKYFTVTVKYSLIRSPDDLPEDTIISGDKAIMEELFGTNDGEILWKSVKKRLIDYPNTTEANLRTLKEISRSIFCICTNNKVSSIQGVIFVGNGPKRYRTVISHAMEQYTGAISCELLLLEEVGGPLQNVDKRIGALLTAIRVAIRIRWEVVRPFSSKIRILARDDARKLRIDLQTCFNNIFSEAEFRGSYSLSDVWEAFEESDQTAFLKIDNDFRELYPKIWRSMGFLGEQETFGEASSRPFSEDDLTLLEAGLQKLRIINSAFLDMAVGRAAVLIRDELGNPKKQTDAIPGTLERKEKSGTGALRSGVTQPYNRVAFELQRRS